MSIKKRIKKSISFIIALIFLFLNIFIQLATLIKFDSDKIVIRLDYILMLALGILTLFIVYRIIDRYYKSIFDFLNKNEKKLLLWLNLFMLIVLITICYNAYFVTGWDVGQIKNVLVDINSGNNPYIENHNPYFSVYPNNLLYFWVLMIIYNVLNHLTLDPLYMTYLSYTFLQCFISTFTAYITYKIAKTMTNNNVISFSIWFIYFIFIGTNFWILVPYTDFISIFLPATMLRLYQLYRNDNSSKFIKKFGYLALIGILGFFSLKIKPQTTVMFLAILIVEFLNFLENLDNFKMYLSRISIVLISIFISASLYNGVIIKSIPLKISPGLNPGFTHFMMLGMNENTLGGWAPEDVGLSESFDNSKERNAANIAVIKQRLNKFGPVGLVRYTLRKTNDNFDDGSFAWSTSGRGPNYVETKIRDNFISPFIKNLYYAGNDEFAGKYFTIHKNFKQIIWLIILFSLPLSLSLNKTDKYDKSINQLLYTSTIGIVLFVTLFESSARYILTFTPIFLVLSFTGVFETIKQYKLKKLVISKKESL